MNYKQQNFITDVMLMYYTNTWVVKLDFCLMNGRIFAQASLLPRIVS